MDAKEKSISDGNLSEGKRTDKEEAKRRAAAFLKNVLWGTLYAICAYFLGGAALPYGAMPLGVAFLSASDRRVFYIYAGLLLSAAGRQDRLLFFGVYTALLVIRLLVRFVIDPPWRGEERRLSGEKTVAEVYPYLFSEHIGLRMASSAVGAFAIGVYRLIEGGLTYYDMYGTVLSTLSAPLAVLLVGGFFSATANKYRRLLGYLAIAFGVVWAVGDRKLYGISLAAFGCMLVTLYLSRRGGTVLGILSGALIGLAISVESVPLFAFAGLVFGMLRPISVAFATISALSVALAWGIYIQGIGVLNGLASALVSASLIFGVLDKLFINKETSKKAVEIETAKRDRTEADSADSVSVAAERERIKDIEKRIEGTKTGLSAVSEALYEISDKLQSPSASDLRQICDNAFDFCCGGCENKPRCWGDRYRETSAALGELCAVLHKNGSVELTEVDKPLSDNCERLPEILSQINHNASLHARQMLEGDRTELFALDYGAVAEMMGSALGYDAEEYETDGELWGKVFSALKKKALPVSGGCVFGKRQRKITLFGDDPTALAHRADEIAEAVREVCPFGLSEPLVDTDGGVLRLTERERLSVSSARRNMRAEGEEKYCGDTSGIFDGAEGRIYAFISDGMGSGRQAALTSGLCGLFIKKLLSEGSSCEGTLKLLNGFLRNRGSGSFGECSATVDLLELDMFTGNASFYKSGAAPTYVFRNGSLFKLRSHTVPMGIIKELDLRKIDFELSRGDLVVMVSDGVTDGREECPWLFDLLRSQGESADPERLAELVVKYAKAEGATDDISVLVLAVKEAA